jgi:hypothetical protein
MMGPRKVSEDGAPLFNFAAAQKMAEAVNEMIAALAAAGLGAIPARAGKLGRRRAAELE